MKATSRGHFHRPVLFPDRPPSPARPRRARLPRAAAPILALVLAVLLPGGAATSLAATTNVVYGGVSLTFRPSDITIQAGDTVVWTNAGGFHTVTGDTNSQPLCGCSSPIPGFTNTFNAAGTYTYHCFFHQSLNMTGAVRVLARPNVPPRLTNAMSFTNGTFVFTVVSTPASTNIVQATTNLVAGSTNAASQTNWLSLSTNVPATNSFTVTDSVARPFPARLYRVVQP